MTDIFILVLIGLLGWIALRMSRKMFRNASEGNLLAIAFFLLIVIVLYL